jgi:hypothetical protein
LLALVENSLDDALESLGAVSVGKRGGKISSLQAAGELRFDIAEKLGREVAVILDDTIDLLEPFALRSELDRAELQPFHEDVAGARGGAADIDPMDIGGEQSDPCRLARADEDRRVHHRVIEMLSLHYGVVADYDVAMMQPFLAIDRQMPCRITSSVIGSTG